MSEEEINKQIEAEICKNLKTFPSPVGLQDVIMSATMVLGNLIHKEFENLKDALLPKETTGEIQSQHDEDKNTIDKALIPISVFSPSYPSIYSALVSLGCEYLNEIYGWKSYPSNSSCSKVYALLLKGRVAILPSGFAQHQIECIKNTMQQSGLPFPCRD